QRAQPLRDRPERLVEIEDEELELHRPATPPAAAPASGGSAPSPPPSSARKPPRPARVTASPATGPLPPAARPVPPRVPPRLPLPRGARLGCPRRRSHGQEEGGARLGAAHEGTVHGGLDERRPGRGAGPDGPGRLPRPLPQRPQRLFQTPEDPPGQGLGGDHL